MSLARVLKAVVTLSSVSGARSSGASHLIVPVARAFELEDCWRARDSPAVERPKSAMHALLDGVIKILTCNKISSMTNVTAAECSPLSSHHVQYKV